MRDTNLINFVVRQFVYALVTVTHADNNNEDENKSTILQ